MSHALHDRAVQAIDSKFDIDFTYKVSAEQLFYKKAKSLAYITLSCYACYIIVYKTLPYLTSVAGIDGCLHSVQFKPSRQLLGMDFEG